jgi:hypothetical protein
MIGHATNAHIARPARQLTAQRAVGWNSHRMEMGSTAWASIRTCWSTTGTGRPVPVTNGGQPIRSIVV